MPGDGGLGHRLGQLAVADAKPACAPAVVARQHVHAHANQFIDIEPVLDIGDQLFRGHGARLQPQVGRGNARRAAAAPAGVARGRQAQLAAGGAFHQPARQHPAVDDGARRRRQAFAVERPRSEAPQAVRIIADGDAGPEQRLVLMAQHEARLAGNRAAADRAQQVADQARRHPAVEHHRHRPCRGLAGVQPLDRPLAGPAANRCGGFEVGQVARLVPFIVALLVGAFPCDHHGRGRNRRAARRSPEPVRGGQRRHALACARRPAFAVADAGHRAGGVLGLQRQFLQPFG